MNFFVFVFSPLNFLNFLRPVDGLELESFTAWEAVFKSWLIMAEFVVDPEVCNPACHKIKPNKSYTQ